jgi:hypothetical protein
MKRIALSIVAGAIILLGGCGEEAKEPPAPIIYTLSVSASPSEGGWVTPSGGDYEEGSQVTVTANAASGYTFDSWGGDASGSVADTSVVMDGDKSITAYFVPVKPDIYKLSVNVSPSGAGWVSPSGGEYEEGSEVKITATAASGYEFDSWGGDASGSAATATLTMDADRSVTAKFIKKAPPKPVVTEQDIEAARAVVMEYWDARNNYDVERVLACLEETYRVTREEEVKSEVSRMQGVGVKIGVEEEADPVITDEGIIELRMKLDLPFPMPSRHEVYYMVKVNGEWKIGKPPE